MDHVATARRLYELVTAGDMAGMADLIADDVIEHEETPGFEPTKAGVVEFFTAYRGAFPDLRMEALDVFGSGDRVAARVQMSGTQQGEFMGMPASGKAFDVAVIDIMRFNDRGQVAEHWGVSNELRMLQQLGAIPEDPPA